MWFDFKVFSSFYGSTIVGQDMPSDITYLSYKPIFSNNTAVPVHEVVGSTAGIDRISFGVWWLERLFVKKK